MFIDLAYNSNQVEQGKEDDHDIFPDYQSCLIFHGFQQDDHHDRLR